MKVSHNLVVLKDQISWIFEQFTHTAKLRNIDFQLEYTIDKELIIRLDEKIFLGILSSMIDNVFKYSYTKSKVTLSVDRWNDHIKFALNGQNLGAKSSELPKIFTDSSTSFSDDNKIHEEIETSLMLALHVSKVMGAELSINVISNQQFSLSLLWPLEIEDGTKKSDASDNNLNHLSKRNLSHHSKNTILLVEDQAEMLEYTCEVLEEFYQVICATNGVEAWQILKNTSSKIDLVISDLMMPEMDGFELLEKLRSDEELMTTPVVLLTARTGDENIVKALSVGVSDYITKPFTKDVLYAHCKYLLSNSINRNKPIAEDKKEGLIVNHNIELKLSDLNWLNKVEKIFLDHITNKYFNMIVLADELAMSERQMRRKLKKITGMSPVQYMHEIKLNNARQMIISEKFTTVSEVSYAVGFETPKYFSTLFKERYGVNPSEML